MFCTCYFNDVLSIVRCHNKKKQKLSSPSNHSDFLSYYTLRCQKVCNTIFEVHFTQIFLSICNILDFNLSFLLRTSCSNTAMSRFTLSISFSSLIDHLSTFLFLSICASSTFILRVRFLFLFDNSSLQCYLVNMMLIAPGNICRIVQIRSISHSHARAKGIK